MRYEKNLNINKKNHEQNNTHTHKHTNTHIYPSAYIWNAKHKKKSWDDYRRRISAGVKAHILYLL